MTRSCLVLAALASITTLLAPVAHADDGATASEGSGGDGADDNKRLRMVVTDFDVSGIPERTARIVADNLVAELRKLDGVSVVGMSEVRAMLAAEADRQTMGCAETSCLAEIADALGADVLIAGRIAILEGATVLSVRRIDQARAMVAGTVEERLASSGGNELLAAIGPTVEKLFPDIAVKAGATRGVPKEKALVLNPPPLPPWSTLTVAGSAVALAGVGVVLGVLAGQTAATAQKLVDDSAVSPVQGAVVVQQVGTASSLSTAANASWGAAGALILGAGVMALFTDWMGYGSATELQ